MKEKAMDEAAEKVEDAAERMEQELDKAADKIEKSADQARRKNRRDDMGEKSAAEKDLKKI